MASSDTETSKIFRYRMTFPADDADSFEAYRGMMAPVFELNMLDARAPFQAVVDSLLFEGFILTAQRSQSRLLLQRSQKHAARSGVDEIIVSTYLEGHREITADGARRAVAPGEILVHDLSRAITIKAEPFLTLSLTIGRENLERHLPASDVPHGLVIGPGAVRDALAGHLNQLIALGPGLKQADSAVLSEMTLAMLGAALRGVAEPPQDRRTGTVTMSALKTAIEQGLGDPEFGPQTLMQRFGLSRATLYRRFEPLGGVTAYIQERRLRQAFRLLTGRGEAELRVSDLAYRHGFASPAAFTKSFKQLFGMTPSEARALAWKPVDAFDTPWRLPKLTERFVRALNEEQEGLVTKLVER
jgi:AraC-like DNA-binding protein